MAEQEAGIYVREPGDDNSKYITATIIYRRPDDCARSLADNASEVFSVTTDSEGCGVHDSVSEVFWSRNCVAPYQTNSQLASTAESGLDDNCSGTFVVKMFTRAPSMNTVFVGNQSATTTTATREYTSGFAFAIDAAISCLAHMRWSACCCGLCSTKTPAAKPVISIII
jgi:hypothetical protein